MKLADSRAVEETVATAAVSATLDDYALNGGAILKLAAGEYILYTNSTNTSIDSLQLTVGKEPEFADKALTVETGTEKNGTLSVLINGNELDLTGGTVEAAVGDASVAKLTVQIKDGKISYTLGGIKTGTTTVTVTASDAASQTVTGTLYLHVHENLVYDFRKANTGSDVNNVFGYVAGLTYEDTGAGGASEKNPQLYSEPWQQLKISNTTSYDRSTSYLDNYQSMGVRFYAVDYSPSFKLKLKEAGTYLPRVTIAGHSTLSGQIAKFTFSKLTDGVETPLYTITQGIDTTAINGPIKVDLSDGPMSLEAGEYVLTVSGAKSEAVPGRPVLYIPVLNSCAMEKRSLRKTRRLEKI